jgi:heat shock protein HslJ
VIRLLAWLPAWLLAACAGLDGPGEARYEQVTGGRWHWVGLLFDAAATAVPDPTRYWVEFASQGGVVVNADCNGGVGRATLPALAVGTISLTRRLCEPRSMDGRFARLLSQVRAGTFDGELLRLHAGASDLLLVRDAGARLVRFVCAAGAPQDVVFGEELAYLRVEGRFRPLRREGSASGGRYGDGELTLYNKGDELIVETRGAGRTGLCVAET